MPLIDVMIPSRFRSDLLERSVDSIRRLATDPERVRIHVAADKDDPGTWFTAAKVADRTVISPRHGYAGLHHYYNDLARLGTGEWSLLWNDDAVMQTPGWDEVFWSLPSQVLVADLWSEHHSPALVTFPAVRRSAIEAVGEYCTGNCHCDTYWQDIGRETHTIASVPVRVHHDRFDLTGNNNDRTWQEHAGDTSHSSAYSNPENVETRRLAVAAIIGLVNR